MQREKILDEIVCTSLAETIMLCAENHRGNEVQGDIGARGARLAFGTYQIAHSARCALCQGSRVYTPSLAKHLIIIIIKSQHIQAYKVSYCKIKFTSLGENRA